MKKIYLFISMLAMTMGFMACSNDEDFVEETHQGNKMVIVASLDEITRTSLTPENKVYWSQGDKIWVGDKEFTLVGEGGSTTGTFEAETTLANGKYDAFYGVNKNFLPATHEYDATKKINEAPMYASVTVADGKVGTSSVQFRNLCGLLKLTIAQKAGVNLRSIKMTADQDLAGSFNITKDGFLPSELNNGSKEIVLDCIGQNGVSLGSGSDFYIYLPAGSYTNVKFVFVSTAGATCTKTLKAGKSIDIERSEITPVTFSANSINFVEDNHDYIDLGLSKLWATKNIGATSETGKGDYYAWGEVASKKNYSWATYEWGIGSETELTSITKYNTKGSQFTSSDDAASVNWAGDWVTPTKADWDELKSYCHWEFVPGYTDADGNKADGFIVYKSKDRITDADRELNLHPSTYYRERTTVDEGTLFRPNKVTYDPDPFIFLPVTGFYQGTYLQNAGSSSTGQQKNNYVYAWASTLSTTNVNNGVCFRGSGKSDINVSSNDRRYGLPIRPVKNNPNYNANQNK